MLCSGIIIFLLIVYRSGEAANASSSEDDVLPSLRIIGGADVEDGAAPYMVALLKTGKVSCGGSIVGDRWILTAAHCAVSGKYPFATLPNITALAGTNSLLHGGNYYAVDLILPYKNYTGFEDIALLRLNTSLPFGKRLGKIELAKENVPINATVQLVGWGFDERQAGVTNVTQTVSVPNIALKQCQEMYEAVSPDLRNLVYEGNMCTYSSAGKRVCYGDSGTPVVWNGMQVAVVVWNEYCTLGYPDVHVSIAYFYDWIQKTMADYDAELD